MIVRCPACHRSYRLDDSLSARRRTVRCSACKHKFTSEPPSDAKPDAPLPAPPQRAEPTRPPGPEQLRGGGTLRRVVLAAAMCPFRSVLQALLDDLGYRVELAEEGIDAFRRSIVTRPDLLIASFHLSGLSGVAICEGVKASPHLKGIKVALVGPPPKTDQSNRDTARACGADLFLEEEMTPEMLRREISGLFGEPRHSGGQEPAPGGRDLGPPSPDLVEGPDAEIIALARLMLSDLRLYYPDRFHQAVRAGTLFEVFSDELSKGRAMLDERYPEVAERHKILAAALRAGVEAGTGS